LVSFTPGFYTSSEKERVDDSDFEGGYYTLAWQFNAFPLAVNVLYQLSFLPLVIPYGGIGGEIILVRGDYEITNPFGGFIQPTQGFSDDTLGFRVFGGGEMKLGPGFGLAEIKYSTAAISHDQSEVSGEIGGLSLTFGYIYRF
jgi:hypothetical protein